MEYVKRLEKSTGEMWGLREMESEAKSEYLQGNTHKSG